MDQLTYYKEIFGKDITQTNAKLLRKQKTYTFSAYMKAFKTLKISPKFRTHLHKKCIQAKNMNLWTIKQTFLQKKALLLPPYFCLSLSRTEWSPIRSVIIRVITKSDVRAARVQFVNHEYDYRPN